MKIFKYKLDKPTTTLKMPEGSKLLCVQTQANEICIWAEVDEKSQSEVGRVFTVYPTGCPLREDVDQKYIGTVQLSGMLVFHIYEIL